LGGVCVLSGFFIRGNKGWILIWFWLHGSEMAWSMESTDRVEAALVSIVSWEGGIHNTLGGVWGRCKEELLMAPGGHGLAE